MAGNLGATLPKKLGIKPGHTVVLLDAPAAVIRALELPDDVRVTQQLRYAAVDVMMVFATSLVELEHRFSKLASKMHPDGGLWVAFPKRNRRLTDISEDLVRRIGLAAGMVDNKTCEIGDWVAIRLVTRLENRDAVIYRTMLPPTIAAKRLRRASVQPLPWRVANSGAGSAMRRARARQAR